MNEAIRLEGYTLDEGKLERSRKKLANDPGWKQWVDKAVNEAKSKYYESTNHVSFATTYQSKQQGRPQSRPQSKP